MAIGVAFLMIAGEFDLSVSSVYALSGFLFVTLANKFNSPLAFIITLAVAAFIGFCNGTITLKAHIPSFVATLGTQLIVRGTLLAITGGESVSYKRRYHYAHSVNPVYRQWFPAFSYLVRLAHLAILTHSY